MLRSKSLTTFALALLGVLLSFPAAHAQEFPGFKLQEIETGLGVGYAVVLVDVNDDGKKDIVVVDTDKVVWYENPTWKKRIIIEGGTKKDNVCIDAYDIDGDGLIDFALGADWKPFNTKTGGTLQWLKRGKTLDEPWIDPSDRHRADRPSHPLRRHRRHRQDGPGLGAAHGPGQQHRPRTGWTAAGARHGLSHSQGPGQGPLAAGSARRKLARLPQLLAHPRQRRPQGPGHPGRQL